MELRPEQIQALSYARRQGSEAPIDAIRGKVGATFRELEALLDSVPAELTGKRPAESNWSSMRSSIISSSRIAGPSKS